MGGRLIDAFPSDPNDPFSVGPETLVASYRYVIASRAPYQMPAYRNDLAQSAPLGGGFQQRCGELKYFLLDSAGEVEYILQSVQEATENVPAKEKAAKVARKLQDSEERFR